MSDYSKIPVWSDVKGDPTARYEYHKVYFDTILEDVEQMTRKLRAYAEKHEPVSDFTIDVLRLQLDGMVKCMSQFYCDVNQGFPGYGPAVWHASNEEVIEIEKSEIAWMRDALDYANEQVTTSNGEINPYWITDCQTDPDRQVEIGVQMQKVSAKIKHALHSDNVVIKTK